MGKDAVTAPCLPAVLRSKDLMSDSGVGILDPPSDSIRIASACACGSSLPTASSSGKQFRPSGNVLLLWLCRG
jgi:hypothetical protein